jgi:23S rRNA G2445 N2-methylase RlmL
VNRRKPSRDKALYRQLRLLSADQLWREQVSHFDTAAPEERVQRAPVVRAVGAAFAVNGTPEQKRQVRTWMRSLLHDPSEKIRRYAIASLPKLGAGAEDASELLALWREAKQDREMKVLTEALTKIGGRQTLEQLSVANRTHSPELQQKIKASLARSTAPSALRMGRSLSDSIGIRLHLHTRKGLERIVCAEVEDRGRTKFRVTGVHDGLVVVTPTVSFSLGDIYALRCFSTFGFVLGTVDDSGPARLTDRLAALITSSLARRLFQTFTRGSVRYRLDFVSEGHQRGAVRQVANRAYALCPEILNDPRRAPWLIAIRPSRNGLIVELSPRQTLDPRFVYRQGDVPAASHPPLAASLARFAGQMENEVVWDPFCGSGLELVERALLGGVRVIHGTDRDPAAVRIAQQNLAAAHVEGVEARFSCSDFRAAAANPPLGPNSTTLVLTNPPMGRRVPVPDPEKLIRDLFSVAATVLESGGRLVFTNPLHDDVEPRSLRLEAQHVVDLGGFHCRLQRYVKCAP